MTVEKKNEKARTIVIDNSEKMDTNADDILNVGYGNFKTSLQRIGVRQVLELENPKSIGKI